MSIVALLIGWLILTLTGMATALLFRDPVRSRLVLLAPVLGAATLAALLHATSWLVSVPVGAVVSMPVLGFMAYRGLRRHGRPGNKWRRSTIDLCIATAIGLGAAFVALLPSWSSGLAAGSISGPDHSMDAFWYVSEASWLTDHALYPIPELDAMPGHTDLVPAYGSAYLTSHTPLRAGQAMVYATISWASGLDPADAYLPTMALWLALITVAAVAALRLLGVPRLPAFVGGAAVGWSLPIFEQFHAQNSASILGTSLILCTIALICRATKAREWVLPAGIVLAGLAAIYAEYLVYTAPFFFGALIAEHRRWKRAIGAVGSVVGAAVLIAPLAWIRGVLDIVSILLVTQRPSSISLFIAAGRRRTVEMLVGTTGFISQHEWPLYLTAIFVVLFVIGVMTALIVNERRLVWLAIGAGTLAGAILLSIPAGPTHHRFVILSWPLMLLIAAIGLWEFARRLHSRAVTAVVVATTLAFIVVNGLTAATDWRRDWNASQRYTTDFTQTADWVREHGGPQGRNVLAVIPDYFESLWVPYALRHERAVSYSLTPVEYTARTSFWDHEKRSFVLVGTGVRKTLGIDVVEKNSRFQLLHLTKGDAIAARQKGWWRAHEDSRLDWSLGHSVSIVVLSVGKEDVSVTFELSNEDAVWRATSRNGSARLTGRYATLTLDRPLYRAEVWLTLESGRGKIRVTSVKTAPHPDSPGKKHLTPQYR